MFRDLLSANINVTNDGEHIHYNQKMYELVYSTLMYEFYSRIFSFFLEDDYQQRSLSPTQDYGG